MSCGPLSQTITEASHPGELPFCASAHSAPLTARSCCSLNTLKHSRAIALLQEAPAVTSLSRQLPSLFWCRANQFKPARVFPENCGSFKDSRAMTANAVDSVLLTLL